MSDSPLIRAAAARAAARASVAPRAARWAQTVLVVVICASVSFLVLVGALAGAVALWRLR